MARGIYTSAAWTANGGVAIAPNAEIEVREQLADTLATIYVNREGPDEITNPSAFADAFGRFFFFAPGIEGGYKVILRQGDKEYALEYQAVGTAGERDTGTAPDELPTNAQRLRQIVISGDSDHTATESEATADLIVLDDDELTADREFVVPDVARRYTIINNRTGDFSTTVKTAAGTGVVVPRGEVSVVRSDGDSVKSTYQPGQVIQTVWDIRTDTAAESVAGHSGGIPNFSSAMLSVDITPKQSGSRLLIMATVTGNSTRGDEVNLFSFAFFQDGDVIEELLGDEDGDRTRNLTGQGLRVGDTGDALSISHQGVIEAPAGQANISVRLAHGSADSETVYLNRSEDDSDQIFRSRSVSTLVVMEIAQ